MKDNKSLIRIDRTILKNPFAIAGAIVLGYWIVTYHSQHALEFLPYAVLLLCPLMHVFMHGKHGHGKKHDDCELAEIEDKQSDPRAD